MVKNPSSSASTTPAVASCARSTPRTRDSNAWGDAAAASAVAVAEDERDEKKDVGLRAACRTGLR